MVAPVPSEELSTESFHVYLHDPALQDEERPSNVIGVPVVGVLGDHVKAAVGPYLAFAADFARTSLARRCFLVWCLWPGFFDRWCLAALA
jgi:hypothetical protein